MATSSGLSPRGVREASPGMVKGARKPPDAIRVLIVDDHELVRAGLRSVFAEYADITIVGEAATRKQARELAAKLRPDVVLMDLKLPDGSGVEACQEILAANRGCRVIMLSSFGGDEEIFAAVVAGASGYILKEKNHSSIVKTIREAKAGRSTFDPELTERIVQKIKAASAKPAPAPLPDLRERDKRILRMISQGKTNKEIAQKLEISDQTVKYHLTAIMARLGFANRSQAAAWAAMNLGGEGED